MIRPAGTNETRKEIMNYFTTLLSSRGFSLYLPSDLKDEIERYVLQHQKVSATHERAPFRRQLDFWALAVAVAIAHDLPPLDSPPSKWGAKVVDTRAVQLPDGLCELLAVVALATFGPNHEGVDDPKQIIDLGNCLAGAGSPELLKKLQDPKLRTTPLDKALEFAKTTRAKTLIPE